MRFSEKEKKKTTLNAYFTTQIKNVSKSNSWSYWTKNFTLEKYLKHDMFEEENNSFYCMDIYVSSICRSSQHIFMLIA